MKIYQRPNRNLSLSLLLLAASFVWPVRWLRIAARVSWIIWGEREIVAGAGWFRRLLGAAASVRAIR